MRDSEWKAIKMNDSNYDGKFYYAVSTTLIFCLPSCPSKLPLRKHVTVFPALDEAKEAGYRPCKRCTPDRKITISRRAEFVEKAVAYINNHLTEPLTLVGIADNVFISPTYLQKIFKDEMNISPSQYVLSVRLLKAKELLRLKEMPVIDIASSIGFGNAGHFATAFKRHVGQSPTQYRLQAQEKENSHHA
ncbi:MAG: bifunctional transcriptional activator/DNA repair enzyme AdaA [Paenisporosarcina sp.]